MKFKIVDSEGRVHNMEERPCKKAADAEVEEKFEVEEKEDVKEETFTKEEVEMLKKLIPHLDELLTLLDVEKEEHGDFEEEMSVDEEFVEGEKFEDSETEEEVKVEEKVKNFHDSKRSFGSIEKRVVTPDNDVLEDDAVAKAWAQRYNK